jgi:RNA polymerase sigma-70 factor (ECF subfamily)
LRDSDEFARRGRSKLLGMVTSTRSTSSEQALLDAARTGDEEAFGRLVEPYRAELHAHCYRMLGSLHDAEDALQEALLRAWRGLPGFEGRSSARAWIYRIATNACLDAIARRPKRVLPVDYGPATVPKADPGEPLVESVWIEPYPDGTLALEDGYAAPEARYEQREAVELAFVAALQHLPARQRAVLILREVLGFSAREVSETLETTVASVNSAMQRARKTVEERLPARSQQETLRELGDERTRELVEAYVDAWARGDVDALRALLAEDVVFSMPPWASWWRGRETVAGFAREAVDICAEARTVATSANAQPALAYYALDAETGRYAATAIDVLTLEGARIKEITAFVGTEAFPRFRLPAELAP